MKKTFMKCLWCEKKISTLSKTSKFYGENYHVKCFANIKPEFQYDFKMFDKHFWAIMDKHDLFNNK